MKSVTLEVIDIIAKDKDIKAGDRRKVIDLIETKVLPFFSGNLMFAQAVAPKTGAKKTVAKKSSK